MSRAVARLNSISGGILNWMAISVTRLGMRLPLRMYHGTPAQRQLSTKNFIASQVSVVESTATPASCTYPGTSWPPTLPGPYCPRTVPSPLLVSTRMALSTLTFSFRTESAENSDGGSIAVRARSCNRWFCTMSRITPALS